MATYVIEISGGQSPRFVTVDDGMVDAPNPINEHMTPIVTDALVEGFAQSIASEHAASVNGVWKRSGFTEI